MSDGRLRSGPGRPAHEQCGGAGRSTWLVRLDGGKDVRYESTFRYGVSCNAKPRHWRDQVGQWLRVAAEWLDGRRSLAIELNSDPALPPDVQNDVLLKGVEHMTRCLRDAAADERREQLLREAMPHVFRD